MLWMKKRYLRTVMNEQKTIYHTQNAWMDVQNMLTCQSTGCSVINRREITWTELRNFYSLLITSCQWNIVRAGSMFWLLLRSSIDAIDEEMISSYWKLWKKFCYWSCYQGEKAIWYCKRSWYCCTNMSLIKRRRRTANVITEQLRCWHVVKFMVENC